VLRATEVAHNLAQQILAYDHTYFIVLVSCNSFELALSTELADVISRAGGFNILELAHNYEKNFGYKTTFKGIHVDDTGDDNQFYHPYAFVGINGLAPGMGFERLRSNQGFYTTTGDQPYAEMFVNLRWNKVL